MAELAVHVLLYVIVNAVYLVLAWPSWLWVTAFWAVGLAVHAVLVLHPAGRRWFAGRARHRGARPDDVERSARETAR